MDFILALTHFCEKHGPKSVLCTQVLPLECPLCVPPRQRRERRGSYESYTTPIGKEDEQDETAGVPRLRRTSTDLTLPPALSQASTAVATQRTESRIEEHAYFQPNEAQKAMPKYPYSQQHVEICASCSFTVPQQVAAKLPEGAPGSLSKDGSRNPSSAPVLRSREFVCFGNKRRRGAKDEPSSSQESQGTSVASFESNASHTNCHDHTLTYLTSKSPYTPEIFATLRQSVLRALSGEQLPHGMSEGPFCFGDSTSGYTIAYSFRLTDPKARGRVRRYAFVALAGNDTYRAFKACPMLWEAFALMSKIIEQAAQRYQDEQEQQQQRERDEQMAQDAKAGYTNISSFLTQRPRDSDGYPRRAGQTVPMNLAEIIGDENIFAVLHQYFVHLLRRLGDKFGGLPVTDAKKMVYQTTCNDHEEVDDETKSVQVSTDMMADMTMEQDEPTAKQKDKQSAMSSIAGSKLVNTTNRPNKSAPTSTTSPAKPSPRLTTTSATMTAAPQPTKKSPQCGPITAEKPMQRRVAV